jgi:hypothetical protein
VNLSVAWLPSALLLVLLSFTMAIGGAVTMTLVSGPISFESALALLVLGSLAAGIPLMWVYAQFAPLVKRDA